MDNSAMSVMEATFYFRLDDGFTGTVPDALRQIADYMDGVSHVDEQTLQPREDVSKDTLWEEFVEHVDDGKRFHGMLKMACLKDGKWKEIPQYFHPKDDES